MTGSGGENRLTAILLPAGVMIGIVIVWELVYRVFKIPTFVVPAPFGIIAETWEWRWRLLGHTWVTLYETLAGFALSIVVGTPLAVVIVYSPFLRRAIYPLLVVAQAMSSSPPRPTGSPTWPSGPWASSPCWPSVCSAWWSWSSASSAPGTRSLARVTPRPPGDAKRSP